jgi:signal transduction histidine kinase/ActR/RegA family two-component response regulator
MNSYYIIVALLLFISVVGCVILYLKKQKTNVSGLGKKQTDDTKRLIEIETQKKDIERAFKKSSKNHIVLQKALRQIEIQKKDLEEALIMIQNQNNKLEIANKEIKQSNKMKEIFLANMSHEIRTPLNAIIGFTEMLSKGQLNTKQHQYIEYIRTSSENLMVIIDDILDFSKIEAGKLILNKVQFDLRKLIKQTVNTLYNKLQEKQIKIKYNISPDIPNVLIGDTVRLNQILINLLGNSIKFTNNNGLIKLTVTVSNIDDDNVKLIFKVEDNGIGISNDKLKDIFKSFTQAESDTTRKYGGTGLGLSIVKQLIELQDGKITVESEKDKGTAFTFYIVMKRGDETIIEKHNNYIEYDEIKDLNILLVEDNVINQILTVDILKLLDEEIVVDIAENGEIALNRIEQNDYDLILMDIQMPIMDGNEATKRIRELDSHKSKIPIIAMTAHALRNEKESCLSSGMTDYISKPFSSRDLFDKILKHIPKNNILNK